MASLSIRSLRKRTPEGSRDDERSRSQPGVQGQRRDVLRTAGRGVLWLFVAIVVVRGFGAILGGDDPPPPAPASVAAEEQFPGPEARSFAGQFARAYLTFEPAEEEYADRIAPYLDERIVDSAALQLPERGPTQRASNAGVARVDRLGDAQALVTVAANVTRAERGEETTTAISYLTVPVYRDDRGGLTVYDLPAFAAPPARAGNFEEDATALQGSAGETAAITDLVTKFLPVYLAGRPDELAFYLPAGTRITPLGSNLEIQRISEVQQIDNSTGPRRTLLAEADVRDPTTRVIYPMRYRLDVVRQDRWLVNRVQGGP